jgi:glycosyltransferase involved in cell wall biosynthesis
MSPGGVIINGRFLGQPVTGVQRFAREVLREWDVMVASGEWFSGGGEPPRVIAPPGVSRPVGMGHLSFENAGSVEGHLWEQTVLARHSPGALLVGLCNTGPVLRRSQLVVIHDASVFAAPGGYGTAFRAWYGFMYRALARQAIAVATVSDFSRRELLRYLGREAVCVPESGEHVRSAEPDRGILKRHALEGRRFVLAVSSMNPNKNFGVVVRAFARLRMPEVRLVVAGGTSPRVFAGAENMMAGVEHLGYVSDAELRALYEAATVFVFPSRYEGFGIPPLEAMACGTPVVASRAASIPETCGDGALYFDPDSDEELAALMGRVLSEQGLRERMAAQGRARSESMTWRVAAQALGACVERAMVRGTVPPRHGG